MSTFKFIGDPDQGGLPKGSHVRIEEAHQKVVIFEGKVSEAVYIDLDPGKYVYSVVRLSGDPQTRRPDDVRYDGEFLWEITESAWKAVRNMKPALCKTINTSEGARWRCLVSTCGNEVEFTAPFGALLHEVVDHLGIPREQFLANPTAARSKMGGGKYEKLTNEVSAVRNVTPTKQRVLGVRDDDLVSDNDNDGGEIRTPTI